MINEKHYFIKIALFGLVLLVSSQLWASNVKSQQDDDLVLMPAISLLLNSTNVIALGPEGELMFPDGSLPAGAKVTVQRAIPPILTGDLIAVGSAFRVTIDKQPTLPVKVILPVPASENPDKLVLIRLESHGRITLLQTEVENGKLVAWTEGFSVLAAARMVEKLKDGYKRRISGPTILPANKEGQYAETQFAEYIAGTRKWEVWSPPAAPVTITYPGNPVKSNRVFLSAPSWKGYNYLVDLGVKFIEPISGLHAFAVKRITIIEELIKLNLDVHGPSVVNSGESFNLKTVVLNTEPVDIYEWAWTLDNQSGDCRSYAGGVCSMQFDVNGLTLDNSSDFTRKETFTITATAVSGDKVTVSRDITVLSDKFRIINFSRSPADDVLIWNESSPVIPISLEVQIHGGTRPINYRWWPPDAASTVWHMDSYNDVDRFDTTIDQPGTYQNRVTSYNSTNTDTYEEFFSVKGNPALNFILSGLSTKSSQSTTRKTPKDAVVDQPVQATLNASGGVMYLTSGHCPDYLYWIDWGDGSGGEYGTIASTDPVAGASIGLTHTYTATGTYTVKYYAIPKGCQSTPFDSLVEQNYGDLPIKTASITVDEAPPPGEGPCASRGLPGPEIVTWKGRQWQRCEYDSRNSWEHAKTICPDLSLAGYSDWRLPTIDELRSLIVCTNGNGPIEIQPTHPYHCHDGNDAPYEEPTIDGKFSCSSNVYWSSSVYNEDFAWGVDFSYGRTGWHTRDNWSFVGRVRCVR